MTGAAHPIVLVLDEGIAAEAAEAASCAGVELVVVSPAALDVLPLDRLGVTEVGLLAGGDGVAPALRMALRDGDRVRAVSILGALPALDGLALEQLRVPVAVWVDHPNGTLGLAARLGGGADVNVVAGRPTFAVYDAALRFCAPS